VRGRSGRALAAGVAVVALYAASAWLSGQLSPLARRPLLDGLVPPTPYRWVDPPPELAGTNLAPASATFRVDLGNRGSLTAIVTTDDAQVTLILPRGAFADAAGQRGVEVTIEPLAPSEIEPPDPPAGILGNVYRLRADYVPSGERAALASESRVVLVYPFLATDHSGHAVISSADGVAWAAVETNDFRSIQQADGPLETLGYVAVAQTGTTARPSAGPGDTSNVATIVIVIGLVVLAGAATVALRPSSSSRKVGRASGRLARGAARGSRRRRSRSTRRD
jgi:hypothetical protein